MKVLAFRSHKAGQGTTVTACAAALHLAGVGHRVALVSNDTDTAAALALPTTDELVQEVRNGLRFYNVAALGWRDIDGVALAGLVGLSDTPQPFDVIVTDLHNSTPSAADLDARQFDAEPVEVVTPCYLALRRSTQATYYAAERRHVVLLADEGRALTSADVASVLRPAGETVTLRRSAGVARQVDAGLLAHRLHNDFAPLAQFVEGLMVPRATLDAADAELAALKARRAAKGGTR